MALFDIFGVKKERAKKPASAVKQPGRTPAVHSGGDCYSYNGSVESYFHQLLSRNFPEYEIRKNVSADSLRSAGRPKPVLVPMGSGSWKCNCGRESSGNFCPDCGARRPVPRDWRCVCGSKNNSNFCPVCGTPRSSSSVAVTIEPTDAAPAKITGNLPLTFVLYRDSKPRLAILLCSKRDPERRETAGTLNALEQACKKAGVPFQRYFREFRNDEAYVLDRIRKAL